MNLEEYFLGLTLARNKVNDARKALDNAIEEEKKLQKKYEQEYIRDNAKFKVGDEVRYVNSPNGKKFIVKDIICVNYNVVFPFTHSKVDIRYAVETKNGWKPNGGSHISEDSLVKVI